MLSLNPGSACDVCAEEYGPHRLPHCIPCGHVLCASCCSTIVEKTAARLAPVCPFCREQFTTDSVRLIRLDFSSSGWSTPRRKGGTIEANALAGVGLGAVDLTGELLARHSERHKLLPTDGSKARIEARRLEDKVAKVAAKKCSVEEVTTLHKELQEWLSSDAKPDDQTSSLFLSAALLRAILMNHVAHSEASRIAKHMEADLKGKLDDLVNHNNKLESELRRERQTLAQKTQECNSLRTELSRLKALASTVGVPTSSVSPEPSYPQSPSPTPPVTPSTNASTSAYNSLSSMTHAPTPLARFNSIHARSASVSSRPSTPAMSSSSSAAPTSLVSPYRSHTPGPSPSRTHTQTPAIRSQTPSVRSYTPSIRSSTPGIVSPSHSQYRSQTPAPPLPHHTSSNNGILPSRPRRLSMTIPSPQKMMRSVSEEKQELHERWIPHVEPDSPVPTSKTPAPYMTSSTGRSRTLSSAAAQAVRYKATSPNDN